ncbi:hypothetical protein N9B94_00575 [Verrucomicrobia bacterium]|nr:hypothetical protein [Verrucomicrobiota bacterium]
MSDFFRDPARVDRQTDASPFIIFMHQALLDSLQLSEQTDQVTEQIAKLLLALSDKAMSSSELMDVVNLSHRATFREIYLNPSLGKDWIEPTQPNSPRSSTQKYRTTEKGRAWLAMNDDGD